MICQPCPTCSGSGTIDVSPQPTDKFCRLCGGSLIDGTCPKEKCVAQFAAGWPPSDAEKYRKALEQIAQPVQSWGLRDDKGEPFIVDGRRWWVKTEDVARILMIARNALITEEVVIEKTPGQIAYEEDLYKRPTYADGSPRKSWKNMDEISRSSWERNPKPRS